MLFALVTSGAIIDVGPPGEPLAGTAWTLVAFGSVDDTLETVVVRPERDEGPYEVHFQNEGGNPWADEPERGLWASDGCMPADAAYATVSDGTLLTGRWVFAAISCEHVDPDGPPFYEGVQEAVSFELIDGDSLRIYYGNAGGHVLVFEPLPSGSDLGTTVLRPSSVRLTSTSPNPFRGSATLHVALDRAGPVSLVIYDVLGRQVATLINEELAAGTHTIRWGAKALPAGSYVARLESGGQVDTYQLTHVQ